MYPRIPFAFSGTPCWSSVDSIPHFQVEPHQQSSSVLPPQSPSLYLHPFCCCPDSPSCPSHNSPIWLFLCPSGDAAPMKVTNDPPATTPEGSSQPPSHTQSSAWVLFLEHAAPWLLCPCGTPGPSWWNTLSWSPSQAPVACQPSNTVLPPGLAPAPFSLCASYSRPPVCATSTWATLMIPAL